MPATSDEHAVLVTGACGHIGREVCPALRASGNKILAVDSHPDAESDSMLCDLSAKSSVAELFRSHPIRAVIHLAAVLPSAFQSDPFRGADVNLSASVELLRQAVNARVKRFVFASSMSVYGSLPSRRPLNEDDPAAPDEPYGAAKRAVELIGLAVAKSHKMEFVSLRIARVVGPGIKKTSSPWRSQIFEPASGQTPICIPLAPEAKLSLVHVQDVARMLTTLTDAARVHESLYNTPAEMWEAWRLKEVIEKGSDVRIELQPDGPQGGPICEGRRFAKEFGFTLRGIKAHLSDHRH
jgi:nucleoside-diphosphate-sugar epimerase